MASGRFARLEKTGETGEIRIAPAEGTVSRSRDGGEKSAAAALVDDQNRPDFVQEADQAFFSGDYKNALRNYSRALQQESAQVYPWIGQISCLIEQKQYREAELWSNRALDQFPEEPSLLSQRARVLALTGNLKRAIGVSDYAISKGATDWAWLARGEVLLQAKDGNALFCFQKAVELAGKESWRVPLLAGLAFSRRRQWANAEEFLRKAVETNPRHWFSWWEYAKVLVELSFVDRARDAITRVRQLNPGLREARDLESRITRRPFLKRLFGMMKR
jgi:tetratricopeptide (TPR) repeat protein